ncbi:hypothetical protein WR25_20637 [Diploscapter pachys]|uniref:Uncharacterized protein n=1 Tax=Diploscapter pachys TaxID=2018661 RepID=A0A2A2L2F4_9BILA|nr:hypothetical protein WR25_20637 [Diploscapter pachys]
MILECTGQTCSTYSPGCSSNQDCTCDTTTDGIGFCDPDWLCGDYPDCSDCPSSTSVCVIDSCCDVPKCIPLTHGLSCPPPDHVAEFFAPKTPKKLACSEDNDCIEGKTCQLHKHGRFCV